MSVIRYVLKSDMQIARHEPRFLSVYFCVYMHDALISTDGIIQSKEIP